jgi:putative Holliday junction resolvase
VGLPLDQNGEIGPQAAKVLAFVETLRELLDIDIVTQDERFSTAAAQRALIDANMRRKKRKSVIDMVAAQHILQTYLDRQRRPGI